ncbi:MAG: o-succinylbenzoate synthase, partial [Myxococcaceae bacterium]|nr:o-succinylbenzoate synthase [Myxococcaceae bacterium]
MKLELRPRGWRLEEPIVTARGMLTTRAGIEVTVSEGGVVGRGEAFPLEAFGTEALVDTERALRAFSPRAIDDVAAVDGQLAALDGVPAARFAAESALLEWLARRRGVPVATLLGVPRALVPVNALIDGRDAAALARAATQAAQQGFKTVKVKVGARPVAEDAQRLLAVRQAVGPTVALRIDANGGWSEGVARATLRGLESLALELCEQPVAAADVEGLRRVSALVPVPVAADEALSD